jgi:hypothetical protein
VYEYTGRRRPGLSRKRGGNHGVDQRRVKLGEARGVESMTDATREEREDRARLADESDGDCTQLSLSRQPASASTSVRQYVCHVCVQPLMMGAGSIRVSNDSPETLIRPALSLARHHITSTPR